jgi:hypothetical protein
MAGDPATVLASDKPGKYCSDECAGTPGAGAGAGASMSCPMLLKGAA